jgi:anti-sigma B factor antagonist
LAVTPFEVTIDWDNNHPAVRVRGELDFATVPALEEALEQVVASGAKEITLDFNGVTFLDSEGLKVLLRVYRHLRENGGQMHIHGCSRFVAKTFEILGLESEFGIDTCKQSE